MRTKRYIVKKPKDPAHPLFDENEVYADYLELKRIKCRCGKPFVLMETEGVDGSEVWARCPDEPGVEYEVCCKPCLPYPNSEKYAETSMSIVYIAKV